MPAAPHFAYAVVACGVGLREEAAVESNLRATDGNTPHALAHVPDDRTVRLGRQRACH